MKKHVYVEKLNVTVENCEQVLSHLEHEKEKIEKQLTWAEDIDVDTIRIENNFKEISDCIQDIKEWKEENVAA